MPHQQGQSNPFIGFSGNHALALEDALINDYTGNLVALDSDTITEPRTLAPVAISILPRHISHFSETKETDRKANPAHAAKNAQKQTIKSIADFAAVIRQGCSWINPVFDNGQRTQTAFRGATTLAVEFDDIVPGENDWQTLAPITKAFAAIPSPSHHTGNKKHSPGGYRLVYRLNRQVCGGEFKALVAKVMQVLGFDGAAVDGACKDSARFWYGAKGAELLWQSEANWNNPLDVDQMLSDRAQRLGIASMTPALVRSLSGVDDNIKKLNQPDFYWVYGVALPKEWVKSRHAALHSIQQNLTSVGLDALAVEIRQAMRGDSEPVSESERQVGDSRSYVEAKAASGRPHELFVVNGGRSQRQPVDAQALTEAVTDLLAEALPDTQLQTAFISIASTFGRPIVEIKEIYRLLEKERDGEEAAKTALHTDIPKLLVASQQRLDPCDYFWGDGGVLAGMLNDEADAKKVPVELLITTLIAVAGSLLPGGSKAIIKATGRYTASPIFRTLVVAPTGRKKTPAQSAIIQPLEDIEDLAIALWEKEKRAFEQAMSQVKKGEQVEKPQPCKQYIVSDVTIEGLIQAHSENPRGLLYYKDEASAFVSAQNMYRGGKGDDSETELAEFNGKRLKKNRVGAEPLAISKTHICRTGSIQTSTLQKLMGDHQDTTGAWARWLICAAPTEPAYIDMSGYDNDTGLHDYLSDHYKQLLTLEVGDYLLASESKQIFQAYQHQLVDCLEAETDEGIKAAYAKAETYLGRLALFLHLVNAALATVKPSPVIDGRTMTAATKMVDYFVGQMLLLHNLNAPGKAVTGILLKLHEWTVKKGVPVSSRETKQFAPNAIRKMSTSDIKALFQQLADAGYGTFDGSIYTANLDSAKGGAA